MAKILVIDDDPQVGGVLERILARAGHTVRMAAGGREGIREFEEFEPDLVITDLNMPDMDGIEVIRELRRIRAEVAIIAVSGGGLMPKDLLLSSAEALGADGILRKPFEVRELLDGVDHALAVRLS